MVLFGKILLKYVIHSFHERVWLWVQFFIMKKNYYWNIIFVNSIFFFEGRELERLGNSTEISQRSGSYAPISRLLKHSRIGAFPSNHLLSTKTNYFTCFWHFNTLNSWSVAPAIPVIANLFQSDILPLFSVFNQRFLCINTLSKKKHLVTHGALLDGFLILKIEFSVHFLHNLTIFILF